MSRQVTAFERGSLTSVEKEAATAIVEGRRVRVVTRPQQETPHARRRPITARESIATKPQQDIPRGLLTRPITARESSTWQHVRYVVRAIGGSLGFRDI